MSRPVRTSVLADRRMSMTPPSPNAHNDQKQQRYDSLCQSPAGSEYPQHDESHPQQDHGRPGIARENRKNADCSREPRQFSRLRYECNDRHKCRYKSQRVCSRLISPGADFPQLRSAIADPAEDGTGTRCANCAIHPRRRRQHTGGSTPVTANRMSVSDISVTWLRALAASINSAALGIT